MSIMMNNKQLGNSFEKRLCTLLNAQRYWVHFLTPDHRGAQPFDIIAVKNEMAVAIECKTLSKTHKYFNVSRLEDNQILAFEKWLSCGNTKAYVAVEYDDLIYMIKYVDLKEKRKIKMEDLEYGISL